MLNGAIAWSRISRRRRVGHLAKVEVEGSNPFARSNFPNKLKEVSGYREVVAAFAVPFGGAAGGAVQQARRARCGHKKEPPGRSDGPKSVVRLALGGCPTGFGKILRARLVHLPNDVVVFHLSHESVHEISKRMSTIEHPFGRIVRHGDNGIAPPVGRELKMRPAEMFAPRASAERRMLLQSGGDVHLPLPRIALVDTLLKFVCVRRVVPQRLL